MKKLYEHKYILASASPRRRELMEKAGFDFEVIPADIDEVVNDKIPVENVAEDLAIQKAKAIATKYKNRIVIAADTVVIQDKKIYGKPNSLEEAKEFTRKFQNNAHKVITGVCIAKNNYYLSFSSTTRVYLKAMNNAEIDHHVNNSPVLDKAGAYGIQDWIGKTKVEKIEGCYYNVVGLPVSLLYEKLGAFLAK